MNIAIIRQGTGRYLFSVPEDIEIKEGEKVKCDTRMGVTDGVVWADSITADEPAAKLIGKLLGAKFPLKFVVGKTVTSVEMFDKPQEEPAQPKAEPIKLYCTADGTGMRSLRKGDVCKFVDNHFVFPDGYVYPYEHEDIDDFCEQNCGYARAGFIPLVSRPAKVGEWVYVTGLCTEDNLSGGMKVGDISNVVRLNDNFGVYIRAHKKSSFGLTEDGPVTLLRNADPQYLVLDGYKPEPKAEPEPEYYNGKVVCVDNGGAQYFEVGKVYCFYNGAIFGANGFYSSQYETLEKANSRNGVGAKFIEFKGE